MAEVDQVDGEVDRDRGGWPILLYSDLQTMMTIHSEQHKVLERYLVEQESVVVGMEAKYANAYWKD